MEREIQFVTVAGRDIPAHKVICPECNVLDLETKFSVFEHEIDTAVSPITARCSRGHEWKIELELPA